MNIFSRATATPVLGIAGFLLLSTFGAPANAAEHNHEHMEHQQAASHDSHAAHDTGTAQHIHHQHGAGSWMFEYRFMRMSMDGLLDGSDSVSTAEVVAMAGAYAYMMAPTKMTMDMHMLMAMYGISDKLSLMLMANYLAKDMDMQARDGTESSMDSSGVGDTVLGIMYRVSPQWMASLGLSVPTGSIDEKTDMVMSATMTMQDVQQPYAMQLGSGTYDLIPSVTYQQDSGHWNWGGQASLTLRNGENDNDYTLGNRRELTAWLKRKLNASTTLSGRLAWSRWGNIDGADPGIVQTMMGMKTSPTADPDLQGGTRTDLLLGVSSMFGNGHMLGLELGVPVQQNLDGPQMETERLISVAYQYMM
jgi:hypothetical protein